MKRKPLTNQLRVRLTEAEREALESRVGPGQTISEAVRHHFIPLLNDQASVTLTKEAARVAEQFSKELQRPVNAVVSDALIELARMLKDGVRPLIIQELKLRQDYSQPRKTAKM